MSMYMSCALHCVHTAQSQDSFHRHVCGPLCYPPIFFISETLPTADNLEVSSRGWHTNHMFTLNALKKSQSLEVNIVCVQWGVQATALLWRAHTPRVYFPNNVQCGEHVWTWAWSCVLNALSHKETFIWGGMTYFRVLCRRKAIASCWPTHEQMSNISMTSSKCYIPPLPTVENQCPSRKQIALLCSWPCKVLPLHSRYWFKNQQRW